MSNNIIEVRELGKKYIINHQRQGYTALRDVIADKTKAILNPSLRTNYSKEEFWALKDVSFDIKQGDRIGIIGRNGAGKSTLLKLISRITEPTIGSIKLKGRVASLLEVGTGFHPELTGRENIYLNGAILGMTKVEIKKKFDEIVEFSEVEKFLDTPVKRYSSGMYVRLAFAVAAHLEPEILIVDEVLAVGDARFQKKCLGKLGDIGQEGRTVLFVSHNMAAIQSLCNSGIVLNNGSIQFCGDIKQSVDYYLENADNSERIQIKDRKDRGGNQKVKIMDIKFYDAETFVEVDVMMTGMPILVQFTYCCQKPEEIKNYNVSFSISHTNGGELFTCSTTFTGQEFDCVDTVGKLYCKIDKWPLNIGTYTLRYYTEANGSPTDLMNNACEINVEQGDYYRTGARIAPHLNGVLINHNWLSEKELM